MEVGHREAFTSASTRNGIVDLKQPAVVREITVLDLPLDIALLPQ